MARFDAVLRCAAVAAFALAPLAAAAGQDPGPKRAAAGHGQPGYPDAAQAGSASRAQGAKGPVAMLSLEKRRGPADRAPGTGPAGNGVDPGSMPFAPASARPK
jgi:hypothetical protein